jgi:hypothetical protein
MPPGGYQLDPYSGVPNRGKPKPGYKDGGMVKTGRAQISGMKFNGTF